MYDNPLLSQYLPQQPALIPPALVPPQKKNWQDKLGQFLIQGDANWNPDDATRRQMVKKGLLEAGLSMLANPTGYGNSPVAGISGGLLRGVQQMNAEAADLRGKTIGINGNRMTDTQRAHAILMDPNSPPDLRKAAMVQLRLEAGATPETFNTFVTPSGVVGQGSNKGGASFLMPGQSDWQQFPQGASQQPAPNKSSQLYPGLIKPEDGSGPMYNDEAGQAIAQIRADKKYLVESGRMTPQEAEQYESAEISKVNDIISRRSLASQQGQSGLPNLSKPEAPKTAFINISPDEAKARGLPPAYYSVNTETNEAKLIKDPTALTPAQEIKQAMTEEKSQDKRDALFDSTQNTIDLVDRITSSSGYANLGTAYGDLLSNVPYYRNPTKDAQKNLDGLSGQIAMVAMTALKSQSAVGATGFGALNQEELKLLKNSIASLEAGGLSHDALDTNIKIVRKYMKKIQDKINGASNSPKTPNNAPNTEQPRVRIKL